MSNDLTHERLLSRVTYTPETGVFAAKFSSPKLNTTAEKFIGCIDSGGYIKICLDRRSYRTHRLAWFYMYGVWPDGVIDHINGIRTDNRIANLRDVPTMINIQNIKKARSNNMSGLLGVTSPKGTERLYRAYIKTKGIRTALGAFDTANQAHEAYINAKRRLHAGCTI